MQKEVESEVRSIPKRAIDPCPALMYLGNAAKLEEAIDYHEGRSSDGGVPPSLPVDLFEHIAHHQEEGSEVEEGYIALHALEIGPEALDRRGAEEIRHANDYEESDERIEYRRALRPILWRDQGQGDPSEESELDYDTEGESLGRDKREEERRRNEEWHEGQQEEKDENSFPREVFHCLNILAKMRPTFLRRRKKMFGGRLKA